MSLIPVRPPGKSGPAMPRLEYRDRRVDAFARLVEAADRADSRSAIAATRQLRGLGYSVCIIAPRTEGGR